MLLAGGNAVCDGQGPCPVNGENGHGKTELQVDLIIKANYTVCNKIKNGR